MAKLTVPIIVNGLEEAKEYSKEFYDKGYQQGRADVIEPIEEFVRECKINKAMDKSCDECKYSHHSHHQTCLEYVLEQLKEQKNE